MYVSTAVKSGNSRCFHLWDLIKRLLLIECEVTTYRMRRYAHRYMYFLCNEKQCTEKWNAKISVAIKISSHSRWISGGAMIWFVRNTLRVGRVGAVVYTGFRGWGGGVPPAFFTLEKSKILHFFKLENFQKMLKNQWKFYKCLKIYREMLRFFEIFWKFYRNFRENLGENLENFGNMDL